MTHLRRTATFVALAVLAIFCMGQDGCEERKGSDTIQKEQQETILKEGAAQTGMPAIKNFRERKILKDIIELRDQEGLMTHTYVFSEMTGKFTSLGPSIGYGISAATQYTNPEKIAHRSSYGVATLPQADPNTLFSPQSAEGTWILLRTTSGDVSPQYIESRISVFTFRLPANVVLNP